MTEIDLLESVLDKTAAVVDGVADDQLAAPTPCPDYDVAALRDHIAAWAQVFAAGSSERPFEGDPLAPPTVADPAAAFRSAAAEIVQGWREHGLDREVRAFTGTSPGEMVFNMTLMEYLMHGWDLATATGQVLEYTEPEAEEALRRAEATLLDEYRGAAFGPRVPIAADAPALDRFVAFLGRDPQAEPGRA